ncbi:hypothetical protein KEM54_006758 [Ascosphaera aggregata]|nr:hypothetical protein KEM54_006758 [Ascosphaera aggregata]
MAYLAPEVYEGKGYLTEVDWWSLGRPFDGKTPEQLAESIKRAQPKYYVTSPAVTIPCLRAISGLLEKDISKRIGAASWASFIYHPFFAGIDFDKLVRKEVAPIFRPPSDKTNFDASYDLEELLLEEAPLEARARRQKPRAELKDDASAKEIREDELHKMIETLFEPFDYTSVGSNKAAPAEVVASNVPLEQFPEGPQQLPTLPPKLERRPTVLPIETHRGQSQAVNETTSCNLLSQSHPDLNARLPRQLMGGAIGQTSNSHARSFWKLLSTKGDGPPSGVIDEVVRSEQPLAPTPPPEAIVDKMKFYPSPNLSPEDISAFQTNGKGSGSKLFASKASGVQMIRDETGSWGNLTDPNGSVAFNVEGQPINQTTARGGANGTGSGSGVFSFFRKKGRERSPRPMERGILGKEGARVIIS